jgi:hypothetical protein
VSSTRYPSLILGLIAGLLGFALMVQCSIGVIVELLLSSPGSLGRALPFGIAGIAPGGAALGAWLLGAHEPERRVRTFKTLVITLIVEAVVIGWLSRQGVHALNVQWVHWL